MKKRNHKNYVKFVLKRHEVVSFHIDMFAERSLESKQKANNFST